MIHATVDQRVVVIIVRSIGVGNHALTASEHVADVAVVFQIVVVRVIRVVHEVVSHAHPVGTDATTLDGDLGQTATLLRRDIDDKRRLWISRIVLVIPTALTHIGHLAAAVHRTVDDGRDGIVLLRDFHIGVLGDRKDQGRSAVVSDHAFHRAFSSAEHIAHGVFGKGFDDRFVRISRIVGLVVVTNRTAHHLDIDLTEFLTGLFIVINDQAVIIDTRSSKSTAAEDGAVDLSAAHLDSDIATHTTRSEVHVAEVSTAAEDVAIIARGAIRTQQAADEAHRVAAEHVAVFTAAKDAAPDAILLDIGIRRNIHCDTCVVDIGEILENTRVVAHTSATAKHVAVHAVQADGHVDGVVCACFRAVLAQELRSRAYLSASDGHFCITRVGRRCEVLEVCRSVGFSFENAVSQAHTGLLTATIHIEKHMAAADFDISVAFHQGRFVAEGIACAAAKQLAA